MPKLQRMQFGKSSEKLRAKTERQIQEAQERISALQEEMAETLGEQYDPALPSALRQSSARKPLTASLPRETRVIRRKRNAVRPVVVKILFDRNMDARSFYWKPENCLPEAETAEYRESVPGDILFDFDSWTLTERGVMRFPVCREVSGGSCCRGEDRRIYGPSWRAGV